MKSDWSICTLSTGLRLADDQSSLCHTPEVSGCEGSASRAQAKACGKSAGDLAELLARLAIVRLVPDIPAEDALVFAERADHALHVDLELRVVSGVGETRAAGALHPAGVVHAGNGRMLRAQLRIRVPAGVEEHEQRPLCCAWPK
jgi:hypothetical protein